METAAHAVRTALELDRAALLAMIRRQSRGLLDPEEILQRAFQRALEHAGQLREPARVHAWLARVARNVLRDELRRRVDVTCSLDDTQLMATANDGLDCWCVSAQLKLLKPSYASILQRVVLDGASVKQVAEELGLSPNNAMVRLHRARAALREQLKSHCGMTCAASCSDCGCAERGCCSQP